MDALGGKKKDGKLFYCLAWAAQWGSAHTAAACAQLVGSLMSSVLQKDAVPPTRVTAIEEDSAEAGVVRWGAWWAPFLLFCSVAFCII